MRMAWVAYVSSGRYDEACETALLGSFNKLKVEQFVAMKNAEQKKRREVADEVYKFSSKLRGTKQEPVMPTHELKAIPKWHNIRHDQITPEMRQERQRLVAFNNEVGTAHYADMSAYYAEIEKEKQKFKRDVLGLTELECTQYGDFVGDQEYWMQEMKIYELDEDINDVAVIEGVPVDSLNLQYVELPSGDVTITNEA